MTLRVCEFLIDECGAVTVDWTVVGAAVVGLGLASVGAVRTGVVDLGIDIDTSLSGATVSSLGTLGGTGWVWTALWASESTIQSWTTYIDSWINTYGYDEASLNNIYDNYARSAEYYIEQGHSIAGAYVDIMYVMQQVMEQNGQTLDSDATRVEDLHRRISATS